MGEFMKMMPVEVRFKPSKGWWIASAPELGVQTQGETFTKAEANLKEALCLFIESCLRRGTLEQVLREAGFSKVRAQAVQEATKEFPFHAAETVENQCRA